MRATTASKGQVTVPNVVRDKRLLSVEAWSVRHIAVSLVFGLMQCGLLGACATRDAVPGEREIRFEVLSELIDKHMDACANLGATDLEWLGPDYLFFQLALVGSIMTGEIANLRQGLGRASRKPDFPSTLFDDMIETCAVMNQRTCLFDDVPRCQNARNAFVRACREIAFCQEECRQQGASACELAECAGNVLDGCARDSST